MRVSIFGLGYVGSVTGACLAKMGHNIIGVDVNEAKVEMVNRGVPPVSEMGLQKLIEEMVSKGALRATLNINEAVNETDAAIICVGTPSTSTGGVNATSLIRVCIQIGEALKNCPKSNYAIFNRSTCLPYIHNDLMRLLSKKADCKIGDRLGYICHPEFLREGTAINDFFDPPKVVFGAPDRQYEGICMNLYSGITAPTFFTTVDVAAMVKYADNCFHALKITFANEMGMICCKMNVNPNHVMDIFCKDTKLNISPLYLKPGMPFGGSCLPKDVKGILDAARDLATPLPMFSGLMDSNRIQIEGLLTRIRNLGPAKVGIIGLTFKEGTDDTRESPMVVIVENLHGKGYPLKIFDKHFCFNDLIGANRDYLLSIIPHLSYFLEDDLSQLISWADVVVISQRLQPELWGEIHWRENQSILDLIGIPELQNIPGYQGLYW